MKKNLELQAANDEMQHEIAELKSMLEKANGHEVMMNSINKQKMVTREAPSFVAEINRD